MLNGNPHIAMQIKFVCLVCFLIFDGMVEIVPKKSHMNTKYYITRPSLHSRAICVDYALELPCLTNYSTCIKERYYSKTLSPSCKIDNFCNIFIKTISFNILILICNSVCIFTIHIFYLVVSLIVGFIWSHCFDLHFWITKTWFCNLQVHSLLRALHHALHHASYPNTQLLTHSILFCPILLQQIPDSPLLKEEKFI